MTKLLFNLNKHLRNGGVIFMIFLQYGNLTEMNLIFEINFWTILKIGNQTLDLP